MATALLALNIARAQLPSDNLVGSVSGQFFISGGTALLSTRSLELGAQPNMVALQPALLAVSCERIKQELLRSLATRDEWRGRIFITLHPAQSSNDPVTLVAQRFAGNWNCKIALSDAMDRNRLAETITHACLLEIANRNAADEATEIPDWLTLGFTRQLVGSRIDEFILQPPNTKENGFATTRLRMDLTDDPRDSSPETRRFNPLAEAIDIMHTNAPLTYDDLCWPTDDQLAGNDANVYRSSAQLFVSQLLRLNNGPASLRAMLAELPNYLNWQLAFQDAFRAEFAEPLDVEKWWALQVAEFAGRDLLHLWTGEESWRQLDTFFRLPIDVQIGTAAPLRTDITFQTVIRGWSRTRQLQLLKKKLWDLDLVRMHVSPEFMPLVDNYRQVLQEYYKKFSTTARSLPPDAPLTDQAVAEAVQQLDTLDARRAAMRPEPPAPVAETKLD